MSDPQVIADKLAVALEARSRGKDAEQAAALVGWSRATLYRHNSAAQVEQASGLSLR